MMWRNLIMSCGRSFSTFYPHFTQGGIKHNQRFLFSLAELRNVGTQHAAAISASDTDHEYIVPYKPEYERSETAKRIMVTLRTKFLLQKTDIETIFSNKTVMKALREKTLTDALDILYLEGVKKENFVEYPWLLTIDRKKLLEKLPILKSLTVLQDINDFVPFLRLQKAKLRRLVHCLNRESNVIEHGNRVYYLANRLNVSPATVTKYLTNRMFILEMPLEMFKTNLDNMINYNVEAMNILKDLWGFRYSPKSVELRLKRASLAKKEKIMPWMVRCPESILQKSLQLSLDELKVLNGKETVAEYLAERLGFSAEEAQGIMDKHPAVNNVRATKIKEVLDYLLEEEKFTRYEVAQTPRILCHSLETTKERINELKKYGCRPSSLVIVCRSKREYEKFLEHWRQNNLSYKFSKQEKLD